MTQLSHGEHATSLRKNPIILLTDNLMGEANIGSLFRLADAFNIEKIIFTGTPVNLNSNRLKRTARATVNNVTNEYFEEPIQPLKIYSEIGYEPIALEITQDSLPIHEVRFENMEKILLVVGNEKHGISNALLDKIGLKVHINMYGRNSSMNVSQAAGIAFYEISKSLPSFPEK